MWQEQQEKRSYGGEKRLIKKQKEFEDVLLSRPRYYLTRLCA